MCAAATPPSTQPSPRRRDERLENDFHEAGIAKQRQRSFAGGGVCVGQTSGKLGGAHARHVVAFKNTIRVRPSFHVTPPISLPSKVALPMQHTETRTESTKGHPSGCVAAREYPGQERSLSTRGGVIRIQEQARRKNVSQQKPQRQRRNAFVTASRYAKHEQDGLEKA